MKKAKMKSIIIKFDNKNIFLFLNYDYLKKKRKKKLGRKEKPFFLIYFVDFKTNIKLLLINIFFYFCSVFQKLLNLICIK